MALIDIGSRKQLFIDDYIIESMTNTKPVMNPAEKVENNPVLPPERPWEGNDTNVDAVIFDDEDKNFKMWYQCRVLRAHQGDGKIIVAGESGGPPPVMCLAISEDGVHWERPDLGLVEFQGSKHNNILPTTHLPPGGYAGSLCIFKDAHEDDPAKRYTAIVKNKIPRMSVDLYYSENAFKWTPYGGNPVVETTRRVEGRDTTGYIGWGPFDFMGWDPIREVYAVHMENCAHILSPLKKRLIGRAESADMTDWSQPETILVPDDRDSPDTEFYGMSVMTYEGIYVGLPWIYRTTNATHHVELAFSRDGIHYDRPYREPFIQRGARSDFDCNSIYGRSPILHGDRMLFFYHGLNYRSPETLLALGDEATGAVGLATLPLDGFVSVDGVKGASSRDVAPYSEMVTRSFGFTGSRLSLNVKAALQGEGPAELRVEVLEPNHHRIDGFQFDDADPVIKSSQSHVVSWNGSSDLSALAGRAIKLRFYFKNAKLYSFQFR